jgi:hypothetical protein
MCGICCLFVEEFIIDSTDSFFTSLSLNMGQLRTHWVCLSGIYSCDHLLSFSDLWTYQAWPLKVFCTPIIVHESNEKLVHKSCWQLIADHWGYVSWRWWFTVVSHFCFVSSVKDGVFRQYKGQRTELEIVNFVKDEIWKELEPVPWYLSPTSVQ